MHSSKRHNATSLYTRHCIITRKKIKKVLARCKCIFAKHSCWLVWAQILQKHTLQEQWPQSRDVDTSDVSFLLISKMEMCAKMALASGASYIWSHKDIQPEPPSRFQGMPTTSSPSNGLLPSVGSALEIHNACLRDVAEMAAVIPSFSGVSLEKVSNQHGKHK